MVLKGESHKKLEWWIEFIQTDLDRLPDQEKSHLHVDFSFYFDPWVATSLPLPEGWWYPPETLQAVQNIVRQFIERIMRMAENRQKGNIGIITLPPIDRQFEISNDNDQFKVTFPYTFNPQKHPTQKPLPQKNWLINDLVRLLEGLPANAVRRCLTCGRIFLHISKKEKKYCSAKCSYRFLSKRRREELKKHPKKYKAFLKKQKAAMRKNYVKRQKVKYGPHVNVRKNGRKEE